MRLLLTLVLFAHSVDAQCDDGNEEGCTSTLVAAPNTVVVGDAIACALTAAVLTETCTGTATDTAVTCGTAGATVALCEAGCTHFPTVVGSCADTDAQLATCVYVAPVASTVEAAGEACMAATASCSACEDDEASGCDFSISFALLLLPIGLFLCLIFARFGADFGSFLAEQSLVRRQNWRALRCVIFRVLFLGFTCVCVCGCVSFPHRIVLDS